MWGNNNIKQLILITLNLITLYVIYVKRREITPEYALKTIILRRWFLRLLPDLAPCQAAGECDSDFDV